MSYPVRRAPRKPNAEVMTDVAQRQAMGLGLRDRRLARGLRQDDLAIEIAQRTGVPYAGRSVGYVECGSAKKRRAYVLLEKVLMALEIEQRTRVAC